MPDYQLTTPAQHPVITLVDSAGNPADLSGYIPPGTYAGNLQLAGLPDLLLTGTLTRDPATNAITAGTPSWPDGATGTYTATLSTTFPGAVDSYVITHVLGGTTTTYTQPAVTRDGAGAVTVRPALVVS